jgi:hypothetical protein
MDYKRQTTVLSFMFVLVGMMFLVPAMSQKAHASIDARAISSVGRFSNASWDLSAGRFILPPIIELQLEHLTLIWVTIGNGFFGGGDERGYVAAEVPGHFKFYFDFFNPAKGPNTCEVSPDSYGPIHATCTITQGVHARATYQVFRSPPPLPGANGGDANSGDEGDNSGDTPITGDR